MAQCNLYLIEGDKLSIQSHQVSGLWHLIQHERDKSGMAFALFASKGGLSKQYAGFNGVLNWKREEKSGQWLHSLGLWSAKESNNTGPPTTDFGFGCPNEEGLAGTHSFQVQVTPSS